MAFNIIKRSLASISERALPTLLSEGGPACLRLQSGQEFVGTSFGAERGSQGEAVFSTSTVGYPESMTDPSYRGQILVFTQPLVGNYGVPGLSKDQYGLLESFESGTIQVEGIIVTDYSKKYSHWSAVESLGEWCKRHNVPAMSNVDTRAIVHILRDQGSTPAAIVAPGTPLSFSDPNQRNLVAEVSTRKAYTIGEGPIHLGVVDCGIKTNILRSLVQQGVRATVLPWNSDLPSIVHNFDGLFLSNGPGNPAHCTPLIENLRRVIADYNKPIFGICMGNQLLALAAGMSVYKMPFGNRGHNQPAIHTESGRCYITSQNHGYAVDDRVLPPGWNRHFVNANDGSNEGIIHQSKPISAVQFHPEAKGGPEDTMYLFKAFVDKVKLSKQLPTLTPHQQNAVQPPISF
ncbi:Multifunctional pyrimidine synthesis protein CAD [Entomophthora muscae]|uniref:Multifunctional pyrimidine synthesis protein CAD n=1 Tax=Entomophthora muscae TaxID=34485 RepID=A0ACC2TNG4_9FUNG|nr:Multifunctional pyrimidine synthesis protein CAD [Entomophthora muscae]